MQPLQHSYLFTQYHSSVTSHLGYVLSSKLLAKDVAQKIFHFIGFVHQADCKVSPTAVAVEITKSFSSNRTQKVSYRGT